MTTSYHRYATVRARRLDLRAVGQAGAATIVLSHGFPASSSMFGDPIPLLADHYPVMAPDHRVWAFSTYPLSRIEYTADAGSAHRIGSA